MNRGDVVVFGQKINFNRFVLYILLILFAVIFVFPYIWMILSSFKELRDIYTMTLLPRNKITGEIYISFKNYVEMFQRVQIGRMFLNTVFICVVNTIVNLFLNSMAAYGFARISFPGRDKIFKLMITSMMVPGTVLLIPNLYIVKFLGMYNTRASLIFPVIMSVYNVFLMRQAFLNSLKEIEEAARIDGCSRFKIFYRITVPQHKPTLVTLGIFTFLYNYNVFITPLLYINDPKKFTLQQGLATIMVHNRGQNYEILLAASVIVSIPLIILFIIFQKYIVEGITVGSVKG